MTEGPDPRAAAEPPNAEPPDAEPPYAVPSAAEPPAAELGRLDHEIATLVAEIEQHRAAWQRVWTQLTAAQARRQYVLSRLHAANQAAMAGVAVAGVGTSVTRPTATTTPAGRPPTGATTGAATAAGPDPARSRPETSTRTAQNVLFALGGLLLGTAAVVFTAVAWAAFGNGGRATILAVVTAVFLAVPVLALRRGLTATGETFAILGLLLVVLDGYAAWYVDLLDAKSIPTLRYAGLVCAATALTAGLYRLGTRLTGPGLVAVLMTQPVLPLVAADTRPTVAGWALLFATLAALNLALVRPAAATMFRVMGATMYGVTGMVSFSLALSAEIVATGPASAAWAGVALLAFVAALAAGSAMARSQAYQAFAAAAMVLGLVIASGRFVTIAWPQYRLVGFAAATAATVVASIAVVRLLPAAARASARRGVRIGSLVVSVTLLVGVALTSLFVAGETVYRALPLWRADLDGGARFSWQLLAAVGLATVALMASVEDRAGRFAAAVSGIVLSVLALPGAVTVAWWAPSAVDVAVAGALALVAVRIRPGWTARILGLGGAVLVTHAVPASLARSVNTAAVLAAVTIVGATVAALGTRLGSGNGAVRDRAVIAGTAAFASMLAVAPGVGAALIAADVEPVWVGRLTAASVSVLVVVSALVATRVRDLTWYAYAATLISAGVWPVVAAVSASESVGIYAGGALVAIAATFAAVILRPDAGKATDEAADDRAAGVGAAGGRAAGAAIGLAALAAGPTALLLASDVLPAVLTVVGLPYTWLDAIWSGDPVGVGLAPAGSMIDKPFVAGTHAIALALVAVAAAITAYAIRPRGRSIVAGLGVGGPTAVLVGLTAAQAPWPVVPATTLLLGILLTTVVAVIPTGRWRATIGSTQGVLYVGAGLAGSLTVQWSTIAGLASIVVAGAAIGWWGINLTVRLVGWCAAVAAGLGTAAASGLAADLPASATAFAILAAATVWLVVGATLRQRRSVESAAVQAGAHIGAVVAVLFNTSLASAAAVCTIWGVAVGLRALWPGTGRVGRLGNTATAAGWELVGWWLLLADRDVAVVEAYTLPLSAVALLAGWAALRARTELNSWIAYGPALAAAFLPSLATVLVLTEPDVAAAASVWRRLLLGVGALAVVVAGTLRRRQAPVVVGGAVLAVVALHETVLYWDLMPRWIPPALGGLLLVGLAMTYERRRRDMVRLREAIGRMS